MSHYNRIFFIAACLAVLILFTACSQAPGGLAATPDAAFSGQTIQAGGCTLTPRSAQVSKRYPAGCTKGTPNCIEMNGDDLLMVVTLSGNAGCNLEQLVDQLVMDKDIYLLAPNGVKSTRLLTGLDQGFLVLGFGLDSPPDNLLLVWGDNPSIKLPQTSSE
ncbi:MAG: hypothetical protein JXB15_12180 [Anaerolineales bacterium]|nr:hypothetical protein [Anaerolineales bacterium]